MKIAFLLYKYFPYGGMQRDFRRFVEETQARGHDCRVYYYSWQGEPIAGAELRQVTVSAITDGVVDGTGTVGYWAIVDATNTKLLAAAALDAAESVTNGNTFTLNAFDIEQPDPAYRRG